MYLYNRDRVWTNFYRELLGGVEKRFTENKNKNKEKSICQTGRTEL